MKGSIAFAAAAAVGANAAAHRRHAHDAFHGLEKKAYEVEGTCAPGCTTIYSTWYGEATLHNPHPPAAATVSSAKPVTTPAAAPSTTPAPTSTSVVVVVPTPVAQTCETPGVYTFPATTLTLSETTTVCAGSTTKVPAGTHTLGGVTTVVTGVTTVTCPYATVSTSDSVTTSVIKTTEYVCPSAGTYTIAPHTTTVTKATTVAVPVVSSYVPGTYTQPEITTTITVPGEVVYCPYENVNPTTSKPVEAVPTTSTKPVEVVPTTKPVEATPTSYAAKPSTPAQSSTPAKPKPTKPSGGGGKVPWAMTYTPYSQSGQCKSKSDVASDIADLASAGIKTIRVYSTDCDTLPNVGEACKTHGIKMLIGIFIDGPNCSAHSPTVAEQIQAIKEWAQWDMVEIITVGNEAMHNGYCTAGEIVNLINTCKESFSGYTGGYTTADVVGAWQQPGVAETLCGSVEYPAANIHPYFNKGTSADQAGEFVKSQLAIMEGICNKPSKCYETGWPTGGLPQGLAVPGVAEQAVAIRTILEEVGNDVCLFSMYDDSWKEYNAQCGECEKKWGCFSALKQYIAQ